MNINKSKANNDREPLWKVGALQPSFVKKYALPAAVAFCAITLGGFVNALIFPHTSLIIYIAASGFLADLSIEHLAIGNRMQRFSDKVRVSCALIGNKLNHYGVKYAHSVFGAVRVMGQKSQIEVLDKLMGSNQVIDKLINLKIKSDQLESDNINIVKKQAAGDYGELSISGSFDAAHEALASADAISAARIWKLRPFDPLSDCSGAVKTFFAGQKYLNTNANLSADKTEFAKLEYRIESKEKFSFIEAVKIVGNPLLNCVGILKLSENIDELKWFISKIDAEGEKLEIKGYVGEAISIDLKRALPIRKKSL